MSLTSTLNTGTSGLAASSLDLEVVGDNIANANTVGFKRGRASFEDALSESLVGGAQVGHGTRLETIRSVLTQGSITNTGVSTDLAISGDGYFVVRGLHNGRDGAYYTRDGQFTLDRDGRLVNPSGLRVQGFQADPTGAISGTSGDLAFGGVTSPPQATATVSLRANLQSDATVPAAIRRKDGMKMGKYTDAMTESEFLTYFKCVVSCYTFLCPNDPLKT